MGSTGSVPGVETPGTGPNEMRTFSGGTVSKSEPSHLWSAEAMKYARSVPLENVPVSVSKPGSVVRAWLSSATPKTH